MSLVCIGGGMAANRLIGKLRDGDFQGDITLVSNEAQVGYNRVLLPEFLAGHCEAAALFESSALLQGNSLRVEHAEVNRIDAKRRRLICSRPDDRTFDLPYKKLVLATGSSPRTIPLPGAKPGQIGHLRSMRDARQLLARVSGTSRDIRKILVVGGGLLGLEAASALNELGVEVSVVHRGDWLMNRQLDVAAGQLLKSRLLKRGIHIFNGSGIEQIAGGQIQLNCGERISADYILVSAGTSPNTELAGLAGIKTNFGIAVDERLQSSVPGIYALGECAEVAGYHAGLVAAVNEQADVLADNLLGGDRVFTPPPYSTRLKVSGIEVYSMGVVSPTSKQTVTIREEASGIYRSLQFEAATLVGAVLLGDVTGAMKIRSALGRSELDSQAREALAFGI